LFDRKVAIKRKKFLKKVVSEGTPVRFQDRHRGRWFDHSANPIFDKQGKVTQVAMFAHDITELKENEEEIIAVRDKLKALAIELAKIEEESRRNFANYLHDRIGQTLFILKIKLEMLAKSGAESKASDNWEEIFKLIENVIEDTRTLSYEMSPVILNELGLEAALEWLVDQTNKQHDIAFRFRRDKQPKPLDGDMCTLLYRATHELLTNIIKHAQAKNVLVSLRNDDNQIKLCIEDDGDGFKTEELRFLPYNNKGFGLFSIKERYDGTTEIFL
jgi:signal transduction histidine kinase